MTAPPGGPGRLSPALNAARASGPPVVQRSSAPHSYTTAGDVSNPYLREALIEENQTAFALHKFSAIKRASGLLPMIQIQDARQYEAVAFVTQTMAFLNSVDAPIAAKFIGRVKGAFQNPADLRGLAVEMLTAVHLQRRNAVIQLPHDGTYDWLANREGLAFEVECKSISGDKGRPIHLRESLDMIQIIKRYLGRISDSLTDGLLVCVTLPEKVPSAHKDRKEIASVVKQAISGAQDLATPAASVTLAHFPKHQMTRSGGTSDRELISQFLEQRYGTAHGRHAVAHTTRANGVLLVAIGSQLGDDVIGETMRTMQKAASVQLTGTRPGLLCVKFEAITADELVDIAEAGGPPTALRVGVHNLWQSRAMERVCRVAFLADGGVEQRESGAWSRVGASYVFDNPKSPFKDDERLRLFD